MTKSSSSKNVFSTNFFNSWICPLILSYSFCYSCWAASFCLTSSLSWSKTEFYSFSFCFCNSTFSRSFSFFSLNSWISYYFLATFLFLVSITFSNEKLLSPILWTSPVNFSNSICFSSFSFSIFWISSYNSSMWLSKFLLSLMQFSL